jgi:hypothetical protein
MVWARSAAHPPGETPATSAADVTATAPERTTPATIRPTKLKALGTAAAEIRARDRVVTRTIQSFGSGVAAADS